MWLQIIVIILGLFGLVLFNDKGPNQSNNRLRYIILIWILLVIQSGLRNLAVGIDTFGYSLSFANTRDLEWWQIWERLYLNIYFNEGRDVGYTIFMKFLSEFIKNFQWVLIIIAIIFFSALCNLIYRNTKSNVEVFVSLCFYQILFYSFFSITGIRQTLAVALVIFAYRFIKNKNLIIYTILIVLAALFHKSALIAWPFYFITKIKNARLLIFGGLIAFVILMIYARAFAIWLTDIADAYDEYTESAFQGVGGPNYILLLSGIIFIILFKYKYIMNYNNGSMIPFVNALVVTIVLAPLVWVDPTLLRVGYYYSIFLVVLFPVCLKSIYQNNTQTRDLIVAGFMFFSLVLIYFKGGGYGFFWEEMKLPDVYTFN